MVYSRETEGSWCHVALKSRNTCTNQLAKKKLMIYVVWLSALCFIQLCFSDKLQPNIAQFDPVLFASWQKKEKKLTIITSKEKKYGSINSPRCPALWFVYILMHGREEWVLVSLGSRTASSARVSRLSFRFLWLWPYIANTKVPQWSCCI